MTLGRIYVVFFVKGLSPRGAQCAKLGFCAMTSATLNEMDEAQAFTLQKLLGYRHETLTLVQTKVRDNGGIGQQWTLSWGCGRFLKHVQRCPTEPS